MNGALPSAACLSACLSARPALATAAAAAVSTPLPEREREREREGGEGVRERERERERERDLGGGSIGSSDSSLSFSLSRSVHLSKTHSSPLLSSPPTRQQQPTDRTELRRRRRRRRRARCFQCHHRLHWLVLDPHVGRAMQAVGRLPACLSACLTTAASELCLCLILVPTDLTDCGVRRGGEEGRRGRQSC